MTPKITVKIYELAKSRTCCTAFGGEKRSHAMAIQISSLVAAHNCLWVGTENGILLTFPFNAPSVVAEETGWEVIKVRISVFVLSCLILNLCVTTYAKV